MGTLDPGLEKISFHGAWDAHLIPSLKHIDTWEARGQGC